MLDGVKLGMVRRVVHNKDSPPNAVGEAHEMLLNDAVEAGVGPPPSQRITSLQASG